MGDLSIAQKGLYKKFDVYKKHLTSSASLSLPLPLSLPLSLPRSSSTLVDTANSSAAISWDSETKNKSKGYDHTNI
jgi:hypothetical protein